jgi:hypothetical protein
MIPLLAVLAPSAAGLLAEKPTPVMPRPQRPIFKKSKGMHLTCT